MGEMCMNKTGANVKNNFFGKVKHKQNGPHEINLQLLLAPFEGDETNARYFCTGCGNYVEINDYGLGILAKAAKISKPSDMKGKYIETTKCGICNSGHEGVKFKDIPSSN